LKSFVLIFITITIELFYKFVVFSIYLMIGTNKCLFRRATSSLSASFNKTLLWIIAITRINIIIQCFYLERIRANTSSKCIFTSISCLSFFRYSAIFGKISILDESSKKLSNNRKFCNKWKMKYYSNNALN